MCKTCKQNESKVSCLDKKFGRNPKWTAIGVKTKLKRIETQIETQMKFKLKLKLKKKIPKKKREIKIPVEKGK